MNPMMMMGGMPPMAPSPGMHYGQAMPGNPMSGMLPRPVSHGHPNIMMQAPQMPVRPPSGHTPNMMIPQHFSQHNGQGYQTSTPPLQHNPSHSQIHPGNQLPNNNVYSPNNSFSQVQQSQANQQPIPGTMEQQSNRPQ